MNSKRIRKIEEAYDTKNWKVALKYLKQELTISPRDIWVLTLLGSVLYEMRRYEEAEYYAHKAYLVDKNDTLAIWHYAGVLHMLGKCKAAIALYKKLIRLTEHEKIADRREQRLSAELQNDSRYRIGGCYLFMQRYDLASKWLNLYLQNRKKGVRSHYTKRDVKDKCEIIERETKSKD